MPLDILAPLVVVAMVGIAAILHMSGMSRVDVLTLDRANEDWIGQYPDLTPQKVTLSSNAMAALVETVRGPGLIWVFGADTVARMFSQTPAISETTSGFILGTGDFTAPRVNVELTDEAERARWVAVLSSAAPAGGES